VTVQCSESWIAAVAVGAAVVVGLAVLAQAASLGGSAGVVGAAVVVGLAIVVGAAVVADFALIVCAADIAGGNLPAQASGTKHTNADSLKIWHSALRQSCCR